MKYCVSCGTKQISGLYRRCNDCYIKRMQAMKVNKKEWHMVQTMRNGVMTTYMQPEEWCAQYCTHCGDEIDMKRIKFATERGGECYTCRECKGDNKLQD